MFESDQPLEFRTHSELDQGWNFLKSLKIFSLSKIFITFLSDPNYPYRGQKILACSLYMYMHPFKANV